LDLTFFGLTPEYRLSLFKQIHEIVFHGNGGYDWHTIYNMPIWLRNFTFNSLKKYYDEQNEQIEAQNNIMTNNNPSKTEIARPNITPKSTYTTITAPKK
jgi:hypothetical protein